jgi:tryptophanyl-tRNA synthetase
VKKRVLSGIKPTGNLTLGNYLGALKHFAKYQDEHEVFIFIADLHALTLPIEPEVLRKLTRDIVAFYLASNLDPSKTTIFLQSQVSEHSELNAILQNYLYMGELNRMTQFKDLSLKMKQSAIGLGLFAYPVLMASDILLYDAQIVPVGEDQKQHVELTRDLVDRFNKRYGNILVMPEPVISKVGARIMSLSNPLQKMSKSDPKGDVFLLDDLKVIEKKIMAAVTDSGSEIKYDVKNKPGISNLISIYASIENITTKDVEEKFKNSQYGEFKKAVAMCVINELGPFKKRYEEIINSSLIEETLAEGALKAKKIAKQTLSRVQKAVGLLHVE